MLFQKVFPKFFGEPRSGPEELYAALIRQSFVEMDTFEQ